MVKLTKNMQQVCKTQLKNEDPLLVYVNSYHCISQYIKKQKTANYDKVLQLAVAHIKTEYIHIYIYNTPILSYGECTLLE